MAAPPTSPARCTTRSRPPDRSVDNSTLWKTDYDRRALPGHVLQPNGEVLPDASPPAATPSRATVTDWVKVPFNEALYGRNYCGDIVCNTTQGPRPRRDRRLGQGPARQRPDHGPDPGLPARPSTSRTATTSTATATSTSPTASSTTSRSSTPVATRRPATRTRAPTRSGATARYAALQQRWTAVGCRASNIGSNGGLVSSTTVPNNPTGVWVGDYTDAARERRPRRVRARVHATTSASRTSTTPPATPAVPRTRTGLLDPDVVRRQHRRRQPRRHRRRADRPRCVGAVPARLARSPGRQGPVLRGGAAPARSPTPSSARTTPATKSPQAVFAVLPGQEGAARPRDPAAEAATFFYSGSGDDLNVTMTDTGIDRHRR